MLVSLLSLFWFAQIQEFKSLATNRMTLTSRLRAVERDFNFLSALTCADFGDMNERPNIFSYSELKAATGDFDDANKLGEGGFGPVYKVFTDLSPSLSIFLFIDLYVHASMYLSLSILTSLSLSIVLISISLFSSCVYTSLFTS